jgi:hypothetical protein
MNRVTDDTMKYSPRPAPADSAGVRGRPRSARARCRCSTIAPLARAPKRSSTDTAKWRPSEAQRRSAGAATRSRTSVGSRGASPRAAAGASYIAFMSSSSTTLSIRATVERRPPASRADWVTAPQGGALLLVVGDLAGVDPHAPRQVLLEAEEVTRGQLARGHDQLGVVVLVAGRDHVVAAVGAQAVDGAVVGQGRAQHQERAARGDRGAPASAVRASCVGRSITTSAASRSTASMVSTNSTSEPAACRLRRSVRRRTASRVTHTARIGPDITTRVSKPGRQRGQTRRGGGRRSTADG